MRGSACVCDVQHNKLTLGHVIVLSLSPEEESQQKQGEQEAGREGLVPEDRVTNEGHLGLQGWAWHVPTLHLSCISHTTAAYVGG